MGHYNKIRYANYYRVITTTYANYCAVDLITLPNLYIQYVNFLSGTKPAKIQDFCGRALTSAGFPLGVVVRTSRKENYSGPQGTRFLRANLLLLRGN